MAYRDWSPGRVAASSGVTVKRNEPPQLPAAPMAPQGVGGLDPIVGSGNPYRRSVREELIALRKGVADLTRERDVLNVPQPC